MNSFVENPCSVIYSLYLRIYHIYLILIRNSTEIVSDVCHIHMISRISHSTESTPETISFNIFHVYKYNKLQKISLV